MSNENVTPDEDGMVPLRINGQPCCLCEWPLPTYDVTFYAPYGGRYMVTIHCPVCQRLWDGDSKNSETLIDHPLNKAASN